MSAQHPACYPAKHPHKTDESSGYSLGNGRAVSEQLPGNISRNTGECPHSGWRNSREASGQLPLEAARASQTTSSVQRAGLN